MIKRLSFMVAVLLLPMLIFAGELSFSVKGDYNLPVAGWNSRNGIQNGFDYVAADKLIDGGAAASVGLDYWFGRNFALGFSTGIGYNDPAYRNYPIVRVPVTLDLTFGFIHTEKVTFPIVLSLGAYGECREKNVSIGAFSALSIGMDVRFTDHFSFGFEGGVEALFEPSEKFRDLSIQLNAVPISMVLRCWV